MNRIRHVTLVLFVTFCAIPTFAAAQKAPRIDTTVSFSNMGVAKLRLISGEIRVTTWDRNAVRVVAHAGSPLNFDVSERDLSLTMRRGSSAKYEVTLPAGTRLELHASSGDIAVDGNPGDVQAQTTSGDIVVKGGRHASLKTVSGDIQSATTGDVQVHTTSGDIVVKGGRHASVEAVSGDIHVSGATGDVKVWSVSGSVRVEKATGAIESETVSGPIRIVDARARRIHLSSTSGLISYTGTLDSKGHYKIESHSGDVTMSLPEDVQMNLDLTTLSGNVENEFRNAVPLSAGSDVKKPRHHQYTIGSPRGEQVSITTFSGNIVIGKRK